ncbi:MAG: peptidase dimerization domain-containing protein [Bryobacteraceae bacterium]
MGSTALTGEKDYSVLDGFGRVPRWRSMASPEVSPGLAKTVIPSKATAKVSFRLVPNQDPETILAAFRQFVKDNAPDGYFGRGARTESRSSGDGQSRSSCD